MTGAAAGTRHEDGDTMSMGLDETLTFLDKLLAPWGKEIDLKAVDYESGLQMLRVTIREKSRFTLIDLDTETASKLASHLAAWAEQAKRNMDS
ncbi:hypothetical protein RIEGSTA812A_PEG_1291 [invertebrate metagenome]|uniref:Uncharacterized protein n=1 Tax=invertebrate metagenome TaxID=1711999 RepID=A0A484HCC7_9ZZZZ